jgi:hypothetical protein
MDGEENTATNALAVLNDEPGSFSTKIRVAKKPAAQEGGGPKAVTECSCRQCAGSRNISGCLIEFVVSD